MDPVYLVLLAAALSALFTAVPLALVHAKGYGRLTEKVEAQPGQMRTEMKLEVKQGLDEHCAEYVHDRASAVAIQAVPPGS